MWRGQRRLDRLDRGSRVHHSNVTRCYVPRKQRWSRGLDAGGLARPRSLVGGGVAAAVAAFPYDEHSLGRLDRRVQLQARRVGPHQGARRAVADAHAAACARRRCRRAPRSRAYGAAHRCARRTRCRHRTRAKRRADVLRVLVIAVALTMALAYFTGSPLVWGVQLARPTSASSRSSGCGRGRVHVQADRAREGALPAAARRTPELALRRTASS